MHLSNSKSATMAEQKRYKRYFEPSEKFELPRSTNWFLHSSGATSNSEEEDRHSMSQSEEEVTYLATTSSALSCEEVQSVVNGELCITECYSEVVSEGDQDGQDDGSVLSENSGLDGGASWSEGASDREEDNTSNSENSDHDEDSVSYSENSEPEQEEEPEEMVSDHSDEFMDSDVDDGADPLGMFCMDDSLHEPLYPGIRTTKAEAVLLIMTYSMRYSLSSKALIALLQLFNQVFARPVLAASRHLFQKIFRNRSLNLSFHFHCNYCMSLVCSVYEHNVGEVPCPHCARPCNVQNLSEDNFFITSSLAPQVKTLFETPGIAQKLNYRHERLKDQNNSLEDIYDGECYQHLCQDGLPLNDSNNFSYSFNSDGTPLYRSSKYSIWPIYIMVNELPPKIRKENLILAGVWVGKTEPQMSLFLEQFVKEAKDMSSTGVNWIPNGEQVNSKLYGLCCCVDAPARAAMQNSVQFNGYYGCSLCYHPGRLVERVVKYPVDVCDYSDRTDDEMFGDMLTAFNENRSIRGIKGPNPLINLTNFPLVWGFPPDYMHCVLLGVARQIAELWFGPPATNPFYIGQPNSVSLINERLKRVECPSIIYRLPRPVSERKYWKASEWYNWLLFFSIPCLQNLLDDVYMKHWYLLVEGIFLLLQKSIKPEDINKADQLLFQFVGNTQMLYGESAMTFNIHSLTHLAKSVSKWGPLWTHSCFPFEAANGRVKSLLTGNKGITLQAMQKFLLYRALPSFSAIYDVSQQVDDYCKAILMGKRCDPTDIIGDDHVEVFGVGKLEAMNEEQSQLLVSQGLDFVNEVIVYNRMRRRGCHYNSRDYMRFSKVSNRYFHHTDGSIGEIVKIIVHERQCFIFFQKMTQISAFNDEEAGVNIPHIKRCEPSNQLHITSSNEIIGNCICIHVANDTYFAYFPNYCALG